MESVLGFFRLALERGWTVGLLLLLFCSGVLAALHFGMKMPPEVAEWSGAGLLLGAAVIAVSVATNLVAGIQHARARSDRRREEEVDRKAEAKQVLASLAALNRRDVEILHQILVSGAPTFEVDMMSDAYRLLQMRIFSVIHDMGTRWICEVHPALIPRREEIIRLTTRRLKDG